MKLHRLGKSLFSKAALATAALSGLIFFVSAPGTQAADRDDGQRRTIIIERHFSDGDRGYYNREADQWREQRREAIEHRDRDYRDREYRNNWDRDRDDYYRNRRDRDRDRD